MSIFKNSYNSAMVTDLDSAEREMEILELEAAREDINSEIEALLLSYRKLTGNRKATKGARKIGRSKKDYSYWHKNDGIK